MACPIYFNPRPLAGATIAGTLVDGVPIISIHAPLRGRLASGKTCTGMPNFNPRPLAGATSSDGEAVSAPFYFNPRPLAGATTIYPSAWSALMEFQSTPPCGGDRLNVVINRLLFDFNPRPLAGATNGLWPGEARRKFQSTPPCGGDMQDDIALRVKSGISIHAPLRGRRTCTGLFRTPGDFNPRPLAGATSSIRSSSASSMISIHAPLRGRQPSGTRIFRRVRFQSTPPCGGDRFLSAFSRPEPYFNPRPLAGATAEAGVDLVDIMISIHAPLRGRPSGWVLTSSSIWISIHAPLRGRPPAVVSPSGTSTFQSTPPCGGDAGKLCDLGGLYISIHAPLRGRRRCDTQTWS